MYNVRKYISENKSKIISTGKIITNKGATTRMAKNKDLILLKDGVF